MTAVFREPSAGRCPAAARHAPAAPRSRQRIDPLAATPSAGPALQRCACGGGCPACRAKAAGLPALPIHPADDVYEREADRVADAVMRGGSAPSRTTTPALPSISRLQRCSCGGSHAGGGPCPECAKKREEEMQRSASSPDAGGGAGVAPPIVHEVLRSSGAPLDADARAFFEPRFGRGFGDVRVHTDARAAESARAVDAVAYTVGANLVFGAGAYRPESAQGRRLIAHELTHVVQQGGGGPAASRQVQRSSGSSSGGGGRPPENQPRCSTVMGCRQVDHWLAGDVLGQNHCYVNFMDDTGAYWLIEAGPLDNDPQHVGAWAKPNSWETRGNRMMGTAQTPEACRTLRTCILTTQQRYHDAHLAYNASAGPNSNSFAEFLSHRCGIPGFFIGMYDHRWNYWQTHQRPF